VPIYTDKARSTKTPHGSYSRRTVGEDDLGGEGWVTVHWHKTTTAQDYCIFYVGKRWCAGEQECGCWAHPAANRQIGGERGTAEGSFHGERGKLVGRSDGMDDRRREMGVGEGCG
jgi:hypothetical protein